MSLYFEVERMRSIVDEIRPLHVAHWEELADLRPEGELNPDYERFFVLEEGGYAVLATARRHGVLIGYCSFLINRDLWTSRRYATGELLYVIPGERGHGLKRNTPGVALFEYAHAVLKHVGITDVYGFASKKNRIARLMRYVGYRPTGKQQYVRHL